MANHSFEDIKNKLLDVLESPEAKIARTTGIAALSVAKPVTGVAVAGADAFLEGYRNFNLRLLLIGMSSGLNIEMQLNKLYDFVTTSDNKNKGVRHCVGIVNKFPERCGKAAFFQNRALIS